MLDLRADDSSPSLALTLVPEPSTVVISAGKYSSLEARGTDALGETSSELERWTVGSRTSEAVVAMSVSVGVGGGRKKRAASGVLLACFFWPLNFEKEECKYAMLGDRLLRKEER